MQNDDRTRIEIRDWMGAIGRRAWLVILIPLVAAFLAAVNEIAAPTSYRSIATVTLLDRPTTGPLTAAVAQEVADFQAAASSIGVLDAAAEDIGVTRGEFEIGTRRSGQGATVLVVATTGTELDPQEVADAIAREALRNPVRVEVAVLEAQNAFQEELVQQATDEFEAESQRSSLVVTQDFIDLLNKRYFTKLDALNKAEANGEDTTAEQADLDRTAVRLRSVQRLIGLDTARNALITSQGQTLGNLARAQGKLAAIDTLAIEVSPKEELGRITPALRAALGAAVFGLLLALGIVAFLEVGTARRRQRRETRTRVMEKQRRASVSEPAARGS